MVSSKGIRIENKKIEAVKQWSETQLVRDIHIFLGFANFYWWFIQGFSRIASPLTSMLNTSGSTESKTQPSEGKIGVGGDSRAGHGNSEIDESGMDDDEVDGSWWGWEKSSKIV